MSHFLDLGSIGQSYGIHLSPRKWENDLAKMVCKKTTKQLSTGESTRSTLYLQYKDKTGSEIQLSFPKSCNGFQFRRSITKERYFCFIIFYCKHLLQIRMKIFFLETHDFLQDGKMFQV